MELETAADGTLFIGHGSHLIIAKARYTPPYYILTEPLPAASIIAPEPYKNETLASFFDVTDRSNPTLTDNLAIDGHYQDSRRIENRLHLTYTLLWRAAAEFLFTHTLVDRCKFGSYTHRVY